MADVSGKPLAGRVAVVTGAGKNIGRSIALALAEEGASIVVNGRSDAAAAEAVANEVRALGPDALPWIADVSDPDAVAAMVDAAVARFGRIDFAISNAGLRRQTPFLKMDLAEWREIMSVALDGGFVLAKACIPHMIEAGGGAFVALSGVSNRVGTKNRVHVCASKAGLEGFVRGLAMEMAEHGITVNAVAPGAIDTQRGASAGKLPGNFTDTTIPLGRKGRPEEIAAMIVHLCSPLGAYVTGQTIHVNGGVYLT